MVARSYQNPKLKKSVTELAKRKKRKNKYGIAIFNLGYRKDVHIKMEEFPKPLVEAFTPTKRDKRDILIREWCLYFTSLFDDGLKK